MNPIFYVLLLTATFFQQCYGKYDFLKAQHHEESSKLIEHVISCIAKAEKGDSKLNKEILQVEGMSTSKCRHLLNNLCTLPHSRYLEVGTWKGSTWVAALHGNAKTIDEAVAIDNWVWGTYGGTEEAFLENCYKFITGINYKYFSENSFEIDTSKLFNDKVNIYFYDGDHTELAQELALTYYDNILDDQFILLVDDWNWEEVRAGTFQAFSSLGYKVLFSMELPADFNGDFDHWWNGLYIAVIQKKS